MSALPFDSEGCGGDSRDLFIKTMGAVLPNARINLQSSADANILDALGKLGQKSVAAGSATSECTTARTAASGVGQTLASNLPPDQLESEASSARLCALSGGTPEPGTPEWTPRCPSAKCSDEANARESCFDGWWKTGEITLNISGTKVQGLECEGFKVTTRTTCELVQEGSTYYGTFQLSDEIHWNDGDVWQRCAPGTSSLPDPARPGRNVFLSTAPLHDAKIMPVPPQCSQSAPSPPQCFGDGQMCNWYRVTYQGGINLRVRPSVMAASTGVTLPQHEVFAVSGEIDGTDSRVYLRLLDGRGWAFDDSALVPGDPSVVRLPACAYPGALEQGNQLNFEWSSFATNGYPANREPTVELPPRRTPCYQ